MTERRQEKPVHSKEWTGFFVGKMIGIRHPVYHNVDRKTRAEPDGRRLEKMTEKSAFFCVLEKNNEKIKKSYYKVFTK